MHIQAARLQNCAQVSCSAHLSSNLCNSITQKGCGRALFSVPSERWPALARPVPIPHPPKTSNPGPRGEGQCHTTQARVSEMSSFSRRFTPVPQPQADKLIGKVAQPLPRHYNGQGTARASAFAATLRRGIHASIPSALGVGLWLRTSQCAMSRTLTVTV